MLTSALTLRSALRAAVLSMLLATPAHALEPQRCQGSLDVPTDEPSLAAAEDAMTCLVNAERADHGLRPLRRDARLITAARKHSADMARREYFAHVTPAGRKPSDRVRDEGYLVTGDGWKVGENLGWGTGRKATPAWVVERWLDSPPHRRILLSPDYAELGVGAFDDAPKATRLPGATYTMDLGVIR
jgi:uncharacterized protein YkwD